MSDDKIITGFFLAPTPNHMSDERIGKLFDDDFKVAEATAAALARVEAMSREKVPELFFRRQVGARAFDLHFEYTSFAPETERWSCIDLNTYDGAADSEAPATFIGRGASEKQARMDLLCQFADYDATPKTTAPLLYSGPYEPNDYGRERAVDDPDEPQ